MKPDLPTFFGDLNELSVTRYGNMLYNRHDVYIGKSIEYYGEYSYGEAQLFEIMARPGNTVLDVGANIGCHTLCLAQAVGMEGRVHAFEPQRLVFQTLCANMALNSRTNVDCHHVAVGKAAGKTHVPSLDYGKMNNYGGIGLGADFAHGELVTIVSIDQMNLPDCHFIKIDVEGMEIDVLQGAYKTITNYMPIIYIENDRKEKSEELLAFMMKAGYRLYWHLPFLFNPQNFYRNSVDVFPKICSVNVIAIPDVSGMELKGFKEIQSANEWYEDLR